MTKRRLLPVLLVLAVLAPIAWLTLREEPAPVGPPPRPESGADEPLPPWGQGPAPSLEHAPLLHLAMGTYVIQGGARFAPDTQSELGDGQAVVYQAGDQLQITAGGQGVRFLLVSGEPIGEPVAWAGPIVMNTNDELQIAFDEFSRGTFIKHHP